jgi:hypothetical protein
MIDKMKTIVQKAIELPKYGYDLLIDSHELNKYEKNTPIRWNKLNFNEELLKSIQTQLKFSTPFPTAFTQFDRTIIKEIETNTSKFNQNNVTRTKAYLDFYRKHPEVHWALLAHLVSRNGGWNMTDLRGSILAKILPTKSRNDFFSFLERANVLIFHDVYPQLLLYEASKQRNKNLFYLLPKFSVSQFMRPFWDYFFKNKDSQLLTVALIINEQNYIEKRVVQHPIYKEKVLENILFKLQEWLQFTYVLFPYSIKGKNRLAGLTVADFTNVRHRVEIGKKLYCLLFGIERLYDDIYQFASSVPHTGSRSDYWPEMFTSVEGKAVHTFSASCRPSNPTVYSPTLNNAWSDVSHTFTDTHDWFDQRVDILHYFQEVHTPTPFDISRQYCQDVNKMIAASSALEMIKE